MPGRVRRTRGNPLQFYSLWHQIQGRGSRRHLEIFLEGAFLCADHFVEGDLTVHESGQKPRVLTRQELREEYVRSCGLPESLGDSKRYPWYSTFADYAFFSSLAGRRPCHPSFVEALPVHKLVETIYRMANGLSAG